MTVFHTEDIYNQRILNVLSQKDIERQINTFQLESNNIHGFPHWLRVAYNGLMLADNENIKDDVVVLFAFFHDVKRSHDMDDPEHGQRGAQHLLDYAKCYKRDMKHIDKHCLHLAVDACSTHTFGETAANTAIACCWDADRLDLYRVGLIPNNFYLNTDTAKCQSVKEWSNRDFISSFNKSFNFFSPN